MADKMSQDLMVLEQTIAKLQVAYEQFFSGGAKEPWELVKQAESILHEYGTSPMTKSSAQFRFNSLQARYNAFKSVWDRRKRLLEGGSRQHAFGVKVDRKETEADDRFSIVLSEEQITPDRIKDLYARYIAIRRKCGERVDTIREENFKAVISEQVKKLVNRTQCKAILIKVDCQDNKSKITAKPFQDIE